MRMILVAISAMALGCGPQPAPAAFKPAPGSPFAVGSNVGRPAVGDLNRDGHMDIAVSYQTSPSASEAHIAVLMGDGKGGFAASARVGTVTPSGLQVAIGDLDEDGAMDLAAIAHDSNELWRFRSDGKGGFAMWPGAKPSMRQGGKAHTHDLVFQDIDGDGHLDALTTNADDNTVSLALGNGKGDFAPAPASPFPAGNHPYAGLSLGDVNGDKALDIAVPNVYGNTVSALLGEGKGSFKKASGSPWPVGPRPSVTALGDVNGDGKLDIIATHDDDALLAVLLGDGKGGFANAAGSPFGLPQRAWGIVVADLDRDGETDLLLGSPTSDLLLLTGDGTGVFGKRFQKLPVGAGGPGYVVLADVNHDGQPDIVTGNHDGGSVSVLLNGPRVATRRR